MSRHSFSHIWNSGISSSCCNASASNVPFIGRDVFYCFYVFRVCNAQHGHRVSYKELAAIVHAFVRRCPQLAPGEFGRLYHYLRVSRTQPQQQQLHQLTERPAPMLPLHVRPKD